jgi:hypothetical protein
LIATEDPPVGQGEEKFFPREGKQFPGQAEGVFGSGNGFHLRSRLYRNRLRGYKGVRKSKPYANIVSRSTTVKAGIVNGGRGGAQKDI